MTLTRCSIVNSTYDTSFDYINGEQSTHTSITPTAEKAITPIDWVFGPAASPSAGSKFADPHCNPLNQIGNDTDPYSCYFDVDMLSTLAYQAVFQAFNERIIGAAYAMAGSEAASFDTSVMDTVMADAEELKFLSQPVFGHFLNGYYYKASLQSATMKTNGALYKGIYNNSTTVPRPLIGLLEEVFQNCVVSMMSSNLLL